MRRFILQASSARARAGTVLPECRVQRQLFDTYGLVQRLHQIFSICRSEGDFSNSQHCCSAGLLDTKCALLPCWKVYNEKSQPERLQRNWVCPQAWVLPLDLLISGTDVTWTHRELASSPGVSCLEWLLGRRAHVCRRGRGASLVLRPRSRGHAWAPGR